MNPPDEQKLERFIDQTLRDLPRRGAPGTLEQRVMAEIARRAALPWWKQNFAHWPMAARIAFLIFSGGLVKAMMMLLVFAGAGFEAAQFREVFATQYAWMDAGATVMRALGDFVTATLQGIPSLWLYGALATIAGLYVTLFGLGAAAYRTLYASR
jgi:hypothetical protein